MNIKRITTFTLSFVLLTACTQQVKKEPIETKKEQTKSPIKSNIVKAKKETHAVVAPQPIVSRVTRRAEPIYVTQTSYTPQPILSTTIEEAQQVYTPQPTYIPQPHLTPLIIEEAYVNNEQMIDREMANDDEIQNKMIQISLPQENTIQSVNVNDSQMMNISLNTTNELTGSFQNNYKLLSFINRMIIQHNFDKSTLLELFSNAQNTKYNIEVTPERRRNSRLNVAGKWDRYRNMFIYERNIQRGVKFWNEHENTLNHAYQKYGVLPEYIVGILGVETAYGVNFGKKRVIDVLTTKAMTGDRRADFYTRQLEKFLLMTRESNLQPSELMGSDAGAMGFGQFIASSYLDFAVDFNEDGVTDLWNAEDAIGSVANYFSRNGWKRSLKTIAVRAKYPGNRFRRLKTGYKTKYSQYTLRKKYKIKPRQNLHFDGQVSLIKLPRATYDELWLGTHNFRVITTYNHSDFYGMVVHKLGEAIKKRRYGH